MPKRTLYVVPPFGSAPLILPATVPSRRVEIVEDDSGANQGLAIKFPEDKFTQAFEYAAGHEPIILGNIVSNARGRGPFVGLPAQIVATDPGAGDNGGNTKTLRAATSLVYITSMGQNATKIRVTEYA